MVSRTSTPAVSLKVSSLFSYLVTLLSNRGRVILPEIKATTVNLRKVSLRIDSDQYTANFNFRRGHFRPLSIFVTLVCLTSWYLSDKCPPDTCLQFSGLPDATWLLSNLRKHLIWEQPGNPWQAVAALLFSNIQIWDQSGNTRQGYALCPTDFKSIFIGHLSGAGK